jgi:tRNA(fMet)-specific endonuclease VapC
VILDTNALSAFADGDAGVGQILSRQTRAAIPVIVLGEFRYGIALSRHRSTYEAWLESELSLFDVLAVTDETAAEYAALRIALKRSGRPIPANDAWIAAPPTANPQPRSTLRRRAGPRTSDLVKGRKPRASSVALGRANGAGRQVPKTDTLTAGRPRR